MRDGYTGHKPKLAECNDKASLTHAPEAKFIIQLHCAETQLSTFNGELLIVCPHCPPKVYANGQLREISDDA